MSSAKPTTTATVPPETRSYVYQQSVRLARRMSSQSITEDTDNQQYAFSILLEVARTSHAAEVERLRAALRSLSTRMFETGPCWCDIPNPELGEHESACATAREAMKEQ